MIEDYRDRRSLPGLEQFVQDARYAIRSLRRNPAFTCIAVFTLALGIAANVSIFAFVDAALLTPLPYDKPTQLVTAFGVRSGGASSQM